MMATKSENQSYTRRPALGVRKAFLRELMTRQIRVGELGSSAVTSMINT